VTATFLWFSSVLPGKFLESISSEDWSLFFYLFLCVCRLREMSASKATHIFFKNKLKNRQLPTSRLKKSVNPKNIGGNIQNHNILPHKTVMPTAPTVTMLGLGIKYFGGCILFLSIHSIKKLKPEASVL
jgi:hypothetical protein